MERKHVISAISDYSQGWSNKQGLKTNELLIFYLDPSGNLAEEFGMSVFMEITSFLGVGFLGLPPQVPETGWLKQQIYFLKFWRLEVSNQGIGRVGFF